MSYDENGQQLRLISNLVQVRMKMLFYLQNFLHKLRGESWIDTELPSGIEYRLVFSRENEAKAVILRHLSSYKKSAFSDIKGSLRVDVRNGEWSRIVAFSRSKGEALQPPIDFYFDRDHDRILYSLDGATFSIPCMSIDEIEARLSNRL